MYTIFINGFEATRKSSRQETITEIRMLQRSNLGIAIWAQTHDGYVYSVEDLEAFENRP